MADDRKILPLQIGQIFYRDPTSDELVKAVASIELRENEDENSLKARTIMTWRTLGSQCLLEFRPNDEMYVVVDDDMKYIILGMFLLKPYNQQGEA